MQLCVMLLIIQNKYVPNNITYNIYIIYVVRCKHYGNLTFLRNY